MDCKLIPLALVSFQLGFRDGHGGPILKEEGFTPYKLYVYEGEENGFKLGSHLGEYEVNVTFKKVK